MLLSVHLHKNAHTLNTFKLVFQVLLKLSEDDFCVIARHLRNFMCAFQCIPKQMFAGLPPNIANIRISQEWLGRAHCTAVHYRKPGSHYLHVL